MSSSQKIPLPPKLLIAVLEELVRSLELDEDTRAQRIELLKQCSRCFRKAKSDGHHKLPTIIRKIEELEALRPETSELPHDQEEVSAPVPLESSYATDAGNALVRPIKHSNANRRRATEVPDGDRNLLSSPKWCELYLSMGIESVQAYEEIVLSFTKHRHFSLESTLGPENEASSLLAVGRNFASVLVGSQRNTALQNAIYRFQLLLFYSYCYLLYKTGTKKQDLDNISADIQIPSGASHARLRKQASLVNKTINKLVGMKWSIGRATELFFLQPISLYRLARISSKGLEDLAATNVSENWDFDGCYTPEYSIPGLIAPLITQHKSLSIDEICQHLGYSTIPSLHGNSLVLDKEQTDSLTQNQTHDMLSHDSDIILQDMGTSDAVFDGTNFTFAGDIRGTDVYGVLNQENSLFAEDMRDTDVYDTQLTHDDFAFASDVRDTNVYLSLNTEDDQNEFHITHGPASDVAIQDHLHAQDDVPLPSGNLSSLNHANQYIHGTGFLQASGQIPSAINHNHSSDNDVRYSLDSTAQISGNSIRSYSHDNMEYLKVQNPIVAGCSW